MFRRKKRSPIYETVKPYVQFSKRIIRFCILNLVIIEVFVMFMVYLTRDTSVLPYLITSLAVQFLGCVIWYLKNSEAEKKVRVEAEIERMKLISKGKVTTLVKNVREALNPEDEPDTFYKGDDCDMNINTDVSPVNHIVSGFSVYNEDEEEDDSVG